MDADELPGDDVVEISSDDGDEDGARDVEYPHFVNDVPTFEARDDVERRLEREREREREEDGTTYDADDSDDSIDLTARDDADGSDERVWVGDDLVRRARDVVPARAAAGAAGWQGW